MAKRARVESLPRASRRGPAFRRLANCNRALPELRDPFPAPKMPGFFLRIDPCTKVPPSNRFPFQEVIGSRAAGPAAKSQIHDRIANSGPPIYRPDHPISSEAVDKPTSRYLFEILLRPQVRPFEPCFRGSMSTVAVCVN